MKMFDISNLIHFQNIEMENITKRYVADTLGLPLKTFYLLQNGRIITQYNYNEVNEVQLIPTVLGGKGGFGSMLRAIGAQIEKTTNREACRDLSGRRLRDINEEKRLKKWINQQAEREKEADNRRQKRLERLCQKPKHEFQDEQYDKLRSELPEKVEDALEQGLKASSSCSQQIKRKGPESNGKNKKPKLWLGSDDELSSSIESEDEVDKEESSNDALIQNQNYNQTSEEKTSNDISASKEENMKNVEEKCEIVQEHTNQTKSDTEK